MKKREYEDWFKACDFIKKEMQFYSVKDFLQLETVFENHFRTSFDYSCDNCHLCSFQDKY